MRRPASPGEFRDIFPLQARTLIHVRFSAPMTGQLNAGIQTEGTDLSKLIASFAGVSVFLAGLGLLSGSMFSRGFLGELGFPANAQGPRSAFQAFETIAYQQALLFVFAAVIGFLPPSPSWRRASNNVVFYFKIVMLVVVVA